jgi:hypothetical protein
MKVRMTNKAYTNGVANVWPKDVSAWEAAGWVADPVPAPVKKKVEEE